MTEAVRRAQPGLFIRSLSIYRAYPGELLRTIPFDTGLNIVAGGHNSGKTTLYRFLRYLLGDKEYANKGTRIAIKTKLPDGGLFGKVFVNGNTWGVWRPFEPKIDSVDSAATISNSDGDEPIIIDPNAHGFARYIAALNDLADEFSANPSFAGTHPLSWNDLLNLYTRDEDSYSKSMYAWKGHAFGAQDSLPKNKKECGSFLLKLFGMDTTELDTASARLCELEAERQLVENTEKESQAKHQRDKDYSDRLFHDANKELDKIFATQGCGDLFDAKRRTGERLKALQAKHKDSIADIQLKAVALGEASTKLQSLEKEQAECKSREQLLNDAAKADERRLQNARETLERIKQRIDNGDVCDDGKILISTCEEAKKFVQKKPADLIKDHGWMERHEAKDDEEKEKIRARLQELYGEIVAARVQEKREKGILTEAEDEERKVRTRIEELNTVMGLLARAKQLEESIQERINAEAGHAERTDKLERICHEIDTNKAIIQEQNALLTEGLKEINIELNHVTQQFFELGASALLKMNGDTLKLRMWDRNGGGGYTYDTVVRPLILDWLTVSYGVGGKSPHHALFLQDAPFQGEMQVPLQKAYLEMILSLSAEFPRSYQQIVLTSSSGANGIEAGRACIFNLTPDLQGRLLPGVDLTRHGFEQLESTSEESD